MTIDEWIRVEDAFTKTFGWDEGIKRMIICKQKGLQTFMPIELLSLQQDRKLRKLLRHELQKRKKDTI